MSIISSVGRDDRHLLHIYNKGPWWCEQLSTALRGHQFGASYRCKDACTCMHVDEISCVYSPEVVGGGSNVLETATCNNGDPVSTVECDCSFCCHHQKSCCSSHAVTRVSSTWEWRVCKVQRFIAKLRVFKQNIFLLGDVYQNMAVQRNKQYKHGMYTSFFALVTY